MFKLVNLVNPVRPARSLLLSLTLVAGLCAAAAPCAAQTTPIAFENARIITAAGAEIERGVLIVQDGRIIAVGPAGQVQLPAGVERVDSAGKVIMPGLVDTHSHVGGVAGADGSAAIQPSVRVFDSLNPFDPGFKRAVAGGITTINIMPGSGHLMSGQTIYVKPRGVKRSEVGGGGGVSIDALFILHADGEPMGGMKMANGTNSIRAAPFPGTRAKSAAMVREQFIKAQEYKAKLAAAAESGDPDKAPARDLALEAMVEILDGKRVVHHHTHRADDIMTVLRLQREFGFRVVLHHVSEAWKVAPEIAAAGVPSSIIVIDSPGGKLEAVGLSWVTGKTLEDAGAPIAFHTDDWITDSRLFLRSAAYAVRAGMSRDGALRALTIEGAKMLDLGERVGTLEAGKEADFIVLSGDPLSVYTKVEQTWIEGRKVFDRADPDDLRYAVGGFGVGSPTRPYMCCADHVVNTQSQQGAQ
jgi:imidazolonepropionase-like amidohydrolase